MSKFLPIIAAAGLFAGLAATPAAAESHRDSVMAACQQGGGGAQECACLADKYAAELGPKELAFYVRANMNRSDPASVMTELGLTPSQVGEIAKKQRDVDARARQECGLPARS